MVGAIFVCPDEIKNDPCQILRAGRRAGLLSRNGNRSVLVCSFEYAVYKVVALAVYPVAPDDEMLLGKFFYIVFAGKLGTSVNGARGLVRSNSVYGCWR